MITITIIVIIIISYSIIAPPVGQAGGRSAYLLYIYIYIYICLFVHCCLCVCLCCVLYEFCLAADQRAVDPDLLAKEFAGAQGKTMRCEPPPL